ncbi:fluoride efflux transporter CrcB [Vreelandella arcis]|nr:fluoride efflux transporter CrcB [Halomonas arcis]
MSIGLNSIVLVAVGGAVGGMARFGIANLFARWVGGAFPWGTLAINLLGAFALGWLASALNMGDAKQPGNFWLIIAVGLLGGFTTVSSFSLQTLGLWQQGAPGKALANVLFTVVLGVIACGVGAWLAGGGL